MKKLFLLTLALVAMCVNTSWAVDWSSIGWAGNGSGNAAYTDAYKLSVPAGCGFVNIQSSFGTEPGFYVTVPSDVDLTCSLESSQYAVQGTGLLLYVSAFTAQETEVTISCNKQSYLFVVYNKNAAPSTRDYTITAYVPDGNAAPYIHFWGEGFDPGTWPQMTSTGYANTFEYTVTGAPASGIQVLFNSNYKNTADQAIITDDACYNVYWSGDTYTAVPTDKHAFGDVKITLNAASQPSLHYWGMPSTTTFDAPLVMPALENAPAGWYEYTVEDVDLESGLNYLVRMESNGKTTDQNAKADVVKNAIYHSDWGDHKVELTDAEYPELTDPFAPVASGKGFGTFQGVDLDLYDWDGNFAGTNACGKMDLYVVTWDDNILFKAIAKDGKIFDGMDYACQLRTFRTDKSEIREHWAKSRNAANTILWTELGASNNPSLSVYSDEMLLTTYDVVSGCGARTIQTVTYTRDYINAPIADVVAPVLTSANVAAEGDNMVVTLSEVTSEEVFYMIVDEDHNKKFISLTPRFVLPKDGSGVTYNFSCYAVDFNGNMSAAQNAEVMMSFNPAQNLALNKFCTAGWSAGNAGLANNGITGDNRWGSNGGSHPTDDWWVVDLGESYNLSNIEIVWEGACSTDFVIKGSDTKPTSWNDLAQYETTLVSYQGTPVADMQTANVHSVTGHHARFLILKSEACTHGCAYGISIVEFRVFGTSIYDPFAAVDDEDPEMTSVSLVSKTYNSAIIAVAATDNVGVTAYKVKDTANGINLTLIAEEGNVTVEGLSAETSYTLSVSAIDAAGNESEPIVMEAFTTDRDPNIPYVAAPIPDLTGKETMGVYSNTVPVVLAHGFNKNTWTGTPYEVRSLAGDEHILYDMRAKTETCWGVDGDGAEGLIALDGYNNGVDKGLDVTEMEYMHIDIWSIVAQPNAYINLADGKLADTPHDGNGWQSFDIPMSEWNMSAGNYSKSNIRWMKFPGYTASSYIAIDNVYFWKYAAAGHDVAAVAAPAEGGSVSVKVDGHVATTCPEGNAATFTATANPGYRFVNWTDATSAEVSAEATYVAEDVTAAISLTANFQKTYTVSASVNNGEMGSAKVEQNSVAASVVDAGTEVIFTATKNTGYDFINWTKGGVEVSTDEVYTISAIDADQALVANFEPHRIVYCHEEILANNGKRVYMTFNHVAGDTYMIRVDGSAEAPIASIYNFNFAINHAESVAENWTISDEGYGYFYRTFTSTNPKTITFGGNYLCFNKQGGGIVELGTNIPAANTIDWTATCVDDEAPQGLAVTAAPVDATSVLLTMNATDNVSSLIHYTINYKPTGDAGEGTNVQVDGTSGVLAEYTVEGLTTDVEYTFSVTASDGINTCDAVVKTATPVGSDTEKPVVIASLDEAGQFFVVLNIQATDNLAGSVNFDITYGEDQHAAAALEAGAEGTKKITGLAPNTDYTFSITATDAAGNTSDAVEVNVTTTSMVAAPAPTIPAEFVRSLYSDAYVAAVAHDFNKQNWGSAPYSEQTVSGNHLLVYDHSNSRNSIVFGDNNDFENAIIAAAGYSDPKDESHKGLDVSGCDYMHFDLWSMESTGSIVVKLNDADFKNIQVTGTGWQSFDLALADFAAANKENVRWIRFDGVNGVSTSAIDNVFFYKHGGNLELKQAGDNVAAIDAKNGQCVNASLDRSFVADGYWYTLCLPFDLSAEQLAEAYGAGYELMYLASSRLKGEDEVYLNFASATSLQAGMPYLFKPTGNSNEVYGPTTFTNVLINNRTPEQNTTYASMVGLYAPAVLSENQYFMGDDNYLMYNNTSDATNAFRCYFTLGGSLPAGVRARVVFGSQVATELEGAEATVVARKMMVNGRLVIMLSDRMYDVQGRLIK